MTFSVYDVGKGWDVWDVLRLGCLAKRSVDLRSVKGAVIESMLHCQSHKGSSAAGYLTSIAQSRFPIVPVEYHELPNSWLLM